MSVAENSRFRRARSLWAVLALALVAVLAWWLWPRNDAGSRDDAPGKTVPVRVARASAEPLVLRLKAVGTVTPLHSVVVRSRVDGELLRLHFQEGQQVNAGDLLAQIDPRPYEVKLAQAQGTQQQNLAELENAERQLQRYRELQKQNYVSGQELSDQQSKVRQLQGRRLSDQASVDEARLQLQYTRITAPVSGRVGLRRLDVGNLVRASDAEGLVTLAQTAPISVLFTVPEPELPALLDAVQAQPSLAVETWDREERRQLARGSLSSLDNRIDTTTGTLKLRAHFDNHDLALFPNQFVNVRLQLGEQPALLIPDAAVQFGSQGNYVHVVGKDNTAQRRVVVLGPADDGRVAVRSGLAAGDQVVIEGIDGLEDGTAVEIIAGEAATKAGA
ncbi:MdtA/MuxA family multidrug efflux RND transporter periplasmic adaptor subunit [Stenotrophomonas sp. GD03908]|uniref:MdtA/MuxA family multidrug efflux RND transporter periplasmic adaptor subunit n=1 Tax=Stenotrophomonas maltophilia TaxID=40324 RepID=A0AAJ2TUF9_STEMA|nr:MULTISPECIES: MdtA/MuxA family multidrug efflux RND transporter periplasmic adaptor subunit [Stenotrophomonas]MBH1483828.1 MdtA/MuxA family multidrug efflux RND transporter periplasmic adaptor subunit [Stenotrophomonas maltophilia]MCU1063423.1 MdtA/MuxA family multidrug efflux RND transporter periplasmic adaptor subunit [Stenotrophomonas maltophilia]MDH0981323.1 MdtA/MuxA family multidrug efflux RND transporter periplasmic adaptor subunit [Stenotrophomonas sp. GD03908]MDQ7293576.1 MdtA/MuxA 